MDKIRMKNILYPLILLSLLAGLALPQSTLATSTQDRAVASEGSQTNGQYYAPFPTTPGGNFTNLNSDDSFTTVLNGGYLPAENYHSYHMQNFTASTSIDGVTTTADWYGGSYNEKIKMFVRISGVNYYSAIKYVNTPGVFQTDTSNVFGGVTNKNPSTGLNWVANDLNGVNDVEWGIEMDSAGHYNIVTYFKITVTYTPVTVPLITTDAASSIACTTATLNGTITGTGGATVDYYGFAWSTTSQAQPGSGTSPAASSYSDNWTSGLGNYPVASYTDGITGLTAGTPYYYRFAAHNSQGWAWSVTEQTFTTSTIPTIIVQTPTNITYSTARLQSYINYDGGAICQVRFGWGLVNEADNITAYTYSNSLTGAYITHDNPYLDISGLTAGATYWFNVEASNICGVDQGTATSFVALSSVGDPSNATVIPNVDSIVVSWVKGAGASNTVVRFKSNDCPISNTDGTAAYLGTASTFTHTGLVSGTDYCYWIVGYDPTGGYSTNHIVIHATTLAAGATTSTAIGAATKPSGGMSGAPSISSALENKLPIMPYVRSGSTETGIPFANFAYGLLMIVLSGLSYWIYKQTNEPMWIAIIWIFVSWIAYPTLHIPLLAPIFVTIVCVGYAMYRMRTIL
jgi:hypothetical protein